MKKIFTMLLVGLMVLSFAGGAFAQGPDGQKPAKAEKQLKLQEKMARQETKLAALKEIQDEIHQINALRVEKNNLQNEVIAKNDTILDLYIQAREAGNKEALQEAKEYKKQIRAINQEIKDLGASIAENRKAAKEALKNDSVDLAEEYLSKVIELKTEVNSKMSSKIALLDQIIEVLS